jgi:hypothetical protein
MSLSRATLLAACLAAAHFANGADDLAAFDRNLAALEAQHDGVAGVEYYRQVRALLDSLNRADVAAAQRYERIVAAVERASARKVDSAVPADLVIAEKRNLALYLLGAPLLDIEDPRDYARLRQRFAASLVSFVGGLQDERIAGFVPESVSINRPFTYRAGAARDARRQRIADEAAMRRAAYQESLANELGLLAPRVRTFLETQYAQAPADRQSLDRFLDTLDE